MAKYKLLAGGHIDDHPVERVFIPGAVDENGKPATRPADLRYFPKDIIETHKDLLRFNDDRSPENPKKFEKLDDDDPRPDSRKAQAIETWQRAQTLARESQIASAQSPSPPLQSSPIVPSQPQAKPQTPKVSQVRGKVDPPLEHMDLKGLQDLAAEEEIDLKGAKTKEEAAKVIRAALTK